MKNADRLFNECLEELKGIDLEPDKHVILKVKSLANAYGYCKPFDDHYIIEIDRKLFSDNLPDDIFISHIRADSNWFILFFFCGWRYQR